MDRFGAKIAGLPVWAWAVMLGLVMVAVLYWSRLRNQPLTVGNSTVPTEYDMFGTESQLGSSGVGSAPSEDFISEFVSNATWLAQGVALLGGQGVSPFAAQVALDNYINGDPLSAQELEWVNRVIASKGLPPQGNAALSEIENAEGRTPSQQLEWEQLQAEKAAADAAARAEAEAAAQAARAEQEASAQAAAQAAADAQRATDESNMTEWLRALRYHSWTITPEVASVFQSYGRLGEAEAAKQDYLRAQLYLSNFRRPQGWFGATADAARQWLAANGYPTS